jgi:AraC-like DNA-binding protein
VIRSLLLQSHFPFQMQNYLIIAELSFVFMLIFILLFMKRNHQGNVYLSVYFLSLLTPFIYIFCATNNFGTLQYVFACLSLGSCSISGIMVYLYVLSISGEIIIGKKYHFVVPSIITLTAFIVIDLNQSYVSTGIKHTIGYGLAPLAMTFSLGYIIYAFSILRKYRIKAENWYSNVDAISMKWLKIITVLSLILSFGWNVWWCFYYLWKDLSFLSVLLCFNLVIVFITAFYIIRQEEVFKDSNRMNETFPDRTDEHIKYSKQKIEDKIFEKYKKDLLSFMEKHKPYLDEDITIRILAERIMIPVHHLSIVINSRLNKNFSSFINEYRVNEALRMLRESENSKINILSVAFRSGFNSKASFNSVFKKMTGKSPSEILSEKN